jgi:hypothetical protein
MALPAYEAWQDELPKPLADAYLTRCVLTAASSQAEWDDCSRHVHLAVAWVRYLAVAWVCYLTVYRMRKALGQPDKSTTSGVKPGKRVHKRYAPCAATHKRAHTWYRKATRAARRVRALRVADSTQTAPSSLPAGLSRKEAGKLDKVLLEYHDEMLLRIKPTPAPPVFGAVHNAPAVVASLSSAPMPASTRGSQRLSTSRPTTHERSSWNRSKLRLRQRARRSPKSASPRSLPVRVPTRQGRCLCTSCSPSRVSLSSGTAPPAPAPLTLPAWPRSRPTTLKASWAASPPANPRPAKRGRPTASGRRSAHCGPRQRRWQCPRTQPQRMSPPSSHRRAPAVRLSWMASSTTHSNSFSSSTPTTREAAGAWGHPHYPYEPHEHDPAIGRHPR